MEVHTGNGPVTLNSVLLPTTTPSLPTGDATDSRQLVNDNTLAFIFLVTIEVAFVFFI